MLLEAKLIEWTDGSGIVVVPLLSLLSELAGIHSVRSCQPFWDVNVTVAVYGIDFLRRRIPAATSADTPKDCAVPLQDPTWKFANDLTASSAVSPSSASLSLEKELRRAVVVKEVLDLRLLRSTALLGCLTTNPNRDVGDGEQEEAEKAKLSTTANRHAPTMHMRAAAVTVALLLEDRLLVRTTLSTPVGFLLSLRRLIVMVW
jgi:hypothetical protein